MRVFKWIIALILLFSVHLNATYIEQDILKLTQNKTALKNFLSRKDQQNLKTQILHPVNFGIRIYGDSHMAADFFPNALRSAFFTPNAIGFAYPLQPKYQQNLKLKYTQKDFEIYNSKSLHHSKINFPLGGIIAKARTKEAFISLNVDLEDKNFVTGFVFKSPTTQKAFKIQDNNGKIVFLSTTQKNKWSYQNFKLSFPIQIQALEKDVSLGAYFITKEKNNLFLDTIAINGAKSDLWLSWNQKVAKKELELLSNQLIILAYGSNDALFKGFEKQNFKNNLKKWIKILKSYNKNAVIMLISPPTVVQKQGKSYKLAPDFFAIRKALYEVAKEEKALLFDMHQFMQDSGGKNKWIEKKLSLNDVHLSIKGYELMAKKLLEDFKKIILK